MSVNKLLIQLLFHWSQQRSSEPLTEGLFSRTHPGNNRLVTVVIRLNN
jgi:hypothetical protein